MLEQVEAFRVESEVLYDALRNDHDPRNDSRTDHREYPRTDPRKDHREDLRTDHWETVTQFKGWTVYDVIAHLHLFDRGAELTLRAPDEFAGFWKDILDALAKGEKLTDYTRRWLGDCPGSELLARWREGCARLVTIYSEANPKQRVRWAGLEMSARSCISARQMETWAHGQAIFDVLGLTRTERDRIYNIVVMGVNTFAWSFTNRGLEVPSSRPSVHLQSPSGAQWEWQGDERNRIVGTAVEFCQVVAQTRNVADTALQVQGDVATRWMSIAQCFAGPPRDPPAPGTRFVQSRQGPARPADGSR